MYQYLFCYGCFHHVFSILIGHTNYAADRTDGDCVELSHPLLVP